MGLHQTPGQDRPPATPKRRLWTVAPAPQPSAQKYEGFEILQEIPTATGLALFEWLRAVLLWIDTDPDRAASLFRPVRKSHVTSWGLKTVAPPLDTIAVPFAQLIAAPERARAERLASACTSVSD